MAQTDKYPRETTRVWLSGLAVTLTTILAFFAFWRLSPGVTFLIGCLALIGLIVAAWYFGREKRLSREQEKLPQRPNGQDA